MPMKIFYHLPVILIICTFSEAQTLYPKIGLAGSVNTNSPQYYKIKPRLGFMAGIGCDLSFSKLALLHIELDYIQKAFQSDYEETLSVQYGEDIYSVHEKRRNRYAVSYFEIPLQLKVRFLRNIFFVSAGPSVSLGLGGTHRYTLHRNSSYLGPLDKSGRGQIKFDGSSPVNDGDVSFDNRWDVGYVFGIGSLIFKKLQIECRYEIGTINLYQAAYSKNRSLQILFSTPIQLTQPK